MKTFIIGVSFITLTAMFIDPVYAQTVQNEEPPLHDHGHEIDHGHEMDEIFATASPHKKNRLDVLQGSNILTADQLNKNMAATIGETLSGLPGISSTFFGPGASRPIIRGLGGDRIRILINGIGSIDAASTSPDHSVAGDPLTAERIEIMRGASTLLYGSNAVGGVVNIIDNRIPTYVPEMGASGRARVSLDTVSNDRSGGASINVAATDNIALHVDGYYRRTDNYNIPGFSESAFLRALETGEEEEQFGTVENSDIDNKGGTLGISWIGDNAVIGVSFNINDSNYGVPSHGHGDEEEGEEDPVRIVLDQKRFDFKANLEKDFLIFQENRLRFGYADYKHIELEGLLEGTRFNNIGWEGRVELIQQRIGNIHGSMGIQMRNRQFSAIGEEAFVPPTDTFQWGVFIVEEIEVDLITFEFGARYDHQNTKSTNLNIEKSFNNLSFSGGAAIHPTKSDLIGISISRSERSPTPEELFSNGPHLATNAFEVGNLNLGNEKAISAEITFKRDIKQFSASLNLYHTWYQNFIFEHETGQLINGLSLLEFNAEDAKFYGAELEMNYLIVDKQNYVIQLSASGDYIHATFNDGTVIPRIPAKSANIGVEYKSDQYDISGDVRIVGKVSKTAANILQTNGYTSIDLSFTWRPWGEERDLDFRLQAQNITNTERRQHTSFLKDIIAMPGRNFKLSLNYNF